MRCRLYLAVDRKITLNLNQFLTLIRGDSGLLVCPCPDTLSEDWLIKLIALASIYESPGDWR
jgi:hypothetical protein